MKNKGFTLVEMLAVIALLAIIGTITAVSVKNIKKNQDEENKLNIISAILTGTRNYITENSVSIVSENASPNESNRVYLDDLLSKGYVDFDIKTGCINYIVVPGPARLCGILGREFEYIIPFQCIKSMGPDIILVSVCLERIKQKCI